MRNLKIAAAALLAVGMMTGTALATHANPYPSTNEANKAKTPVQWAHVNQISQGIGTVTLEFVSKRNFASCFEYRTDGDTSQQTSPTNFNTEIHDGLYPFLCVNNTTVQRTFEADEYVEVRLSFGAEKSERFDWTRFNVLPDAKTVDDCKEGSYQAFGFKNQGACMQFVNTGKDSR